MAPLEYTLMMTRPPGSSTKTGGLQVWRAGVDEGAGRVGDGGGVGAVTNREPQAVPGDQVLCGGLVVH
jgi:hypothetical protein